MNLPETISPAETDPESGDGADATAALYERILDDARERFETARKLLRAAKQDLAASQAKAEALEAKLLESGAQAPTADAPGSRDAVAAEVRRGAAKFDELKRRAREAVGQRDALIEQLRGRIGRRDAEIERFRAAAALGAGGLSAEEARARDQYEAGRLGRGKVWALLLIRALPAMPVASIAAMGVMRAATPARGAGNPFDAFLAATLVSALVIGIGCLCAVWLLWGQLGPRWIWLRRVNTRTRKLEAMTSGGQSLALAMEDFQLEKSPMLSLLGLAVVRRTADRRKFVTSEPGAWLQGPFAPAQRWRLGIDLATMLCIAGWIAWAAYLAGRA